ncbi:MULTISPECIES: hypothetical protein [Pseudomonas]|uniref:Uncharacterized protein n=1 Tax=Pseudomonas eucalypticola TaxID=2599595 RepID=A0A7D5D9D2_9PSED|nr:MULTISPECIES: hypothetical protein [Pseudomonas]QKZ06140.1 hypothetical protein HWQ56_21130 [Pseudomonas eucalypticola]
MKKWQIAFIDEHGQQLNLQIDADQRPDKDEAARHVRAYYRPVLAKADLNDFDNRAPEPAAKALKEMNAMEIVSVTPVD